MTSVSRAHDDATPPPPSLATSGIAGLDQILAGGFARRRMYLVRGSPGSGKTTLAMQYLQAGLRDGEPGLYVTLSESSEEIAAVVASHGWALEGLETITLEDVDDLIQGDAHTTVFHPSEVELRVVTDLVREASRRIVPRRVVFDSLSEFRLLAEAPLRFRHHLLELKRLFAELGSTVLLLDDNNTHPGGHDPHVLSLAHGVVDLTQHPAGYGLPRRTLQVTKLRGTRQREGQHDFVIATGGLQVFPRLVAAEHQHAFAPVPVASGNAQLDALLGGGVDRGTTTLLAGPAGAGKSTVALTYVSSLLDQGHRAALFYFDEVPAIALRRADALGMELEAHRREGRLSMEQIDPAELSPGEFAHRVQQVVSEGAAMVVIDSLNGYLHAMPDEEYLIHQLHELASYLNQQGVATVLVLAHHGAFPDPAASLDLSYLADTVVSLRFFEAMGEVRRAIATVKKRSGSHESTIREFRFRAGSGVEVGPPLTEFSGVLTGTPRYLGPDEKMLGH